jgi:hypothetical protein
MGLSLWISLVGLIYLKAILCAGPLSKALIHFSKGTLVKPG